MKFKTLLKKLRASGFEVKVGLDQDDNLFLYGTQPSVKKATGPFGGESKYPHTLMIMLNAGSWWGDQAELDSRISEYNERCRADA